MSKRISVAMFAALSIGCVPAAPVANITAASVKTTALGENVTRFVDEDLGVACYLVRSPGEYAGTKLSCVAVPRAVLEVDCGE